ncbi:MAG: DUF6311 domain-containing protein [Myxococcota bacterium]|jgi:hypothetical protein
MSLAPRVQLAIVLTVVVAFGVGWFHALGLGQTLNPTNVSWMLEGDWMGHLFGWLFTRNGPWALPLATAPDLAWPAGSSAALTDAIPLASVLAKLVSPLAPLNFQFFGLWMFLGVVGLGVTGVLLLRPHVKDPVVLTLGGMVFVLNPIVSTRYGHPPFFGFWAITALVGLNLWPVEDLQTARRVATAALVLGFLGCAMNAYLAVMCSGVMLAAVVRLALLGHLPRKEAAAWIVATPLVSLLSLWLFGFVAGATSSPMSNLAAEGFGQFSADLLTFVNATIWSRFLPGIATGPRQYEGFAYLGLGVLALLALRLVLLTWRRPTKADWKGLAPLLVVALGMSFYALSNHVTIAGKPIADFSALYAKLGALPSVFRSSGRFVWPLHALLTFVAVLTSARFFRPWAARAVLGVALLVQLVDFDATKTPLHKQAAEFVPFRAPEWDLLGKDYRHIAIQPVQIQWICPFNPVLVAKLSWEAYRQHLSINSGHVGRAPPGTDCRRHLPPGELDPQTVYIPYFPEYFADFLAPGWVCGVLEGVPLCVSPDRDTALKQLLQQRPLTR